MKTQQNVLGREEQTFDVKENQKLIIFSQLKPITKNLDAQTKTKLKLKIILVKRLKLNPTKSKICNFLVHVQ